MSPICCSAWVITSSNNSQVMPLIQISEHFSRDELLASSTAARRGYQVQLDRWTLEQLERLVKTCLQPARDALGVPFVITSGFRPPWLNKMIKGAADSRHMYGCAADFKTPGKPLAQAFAEIRELDLPIDQLILENPPAGWIHLGIALPGQQPRKQYMMANRTADGRMEFKHV